MQGPITSATNKNNNSKKICVNASGYLKDSGINLKNKENIRGHYRTGDVNSNVELPMHAISGTEPLRYRCEDCHIRETKIDPWFRKLNIPENKPQMQDELGRISPGYYWQYLNNLEIEGKRDAPPKPPISFYSIINEDKNV